MPTAEGPARGVRLLGVDPPCLARADDVLARRGTAFVREDVLEREREDAVPEVEHALCCFVKARLRRFTGRGRECDRRDLRVAEGACSDRLLSAGPGSTDRNREREFEAPSDRGRGIALGLRVTDRNREPTPGRGWGALEELSTVRAAAAGDASSELERAPACAGSPEVSGGRAAAKARNSERTCWRLRFWVASTPMACSVLGRAAPLSVCGKNLRLPLGFGSTDRNREREGSPFLD